MIVPKAGAGEIATAHQQPSPLRPQEQRQFGVKRLKGR